MPENQKSTGEGGSEVSPAESGLLPAQDQTMGSGHAWRWFVPACRGTFISRPNRFIALVDLDGRTVTCHCPNPGRMGELLFPGTPVLLEEAPQGRKTPYTLAAILHRPLDGSRECVVPVAASRANQAVAALVLPRLFPGAGRIRPEYAIGHSRFDFLVEEPSPGTTGNQALATDKDGSPCMAGENPAGLARYQTALKENLPLHRHLVEVKSVTEVEFGTACFPDAPSLRASRHLRELKELAEEIGPTGLPDRNAWTCHVVFAITHSRPHRLVPNLHTDPEFARTLSEAAGSVRFHAVLLELDQDGWCRLAGPGLPAVPVDTSFGSLAEANRGNYLVTMELPADLDLEAGALGPRHLEKGWYVYCGSAAKNLRQRMARQTRKTGKARHWHLDWLVPHCRDLKAHATASLENLECVMAQGLADLGARGVKGFGSSDCGCPSHLYHCASNPLQDRGFQTLLMKLRHQTSLGA